MNWQQFQYVIDEVAPEDGGGYRAYYPTIGYGLIGHGDDGFSAVVNLLEGQESYEQALRDFGLEAPTPSADDLICTTRKCGAENNYAYAA